MGRAVSSGAFGTKDPDTPKGAGFISARKGALPVAVGPVHVSLLLLALISGRGQITCEEFWCGLKVLWYFARGAACCGSLPLDEIKEPCADHGERGY